ncbi:helix-turn-helix transcriptional regulator [Olleya sp. YSTF-M6]|uniref:Helix-turn-helix transcriptional regulator n=1 Tax=Olleya sediminilitoris TaxID=2795739 RepID=A0ABS1WP63_9FLAO|nr:AraC family transcriptional regulator [Olleya sediminilitoris]MBL7560893.1 helix-turn-helix transcriptional regulator [Olleya sediminilitoris]
MLNKIKEQSKKEMIFDTIESITIENQTTEFPKHYHETFCFSLVYKGVNQIDFKNQSVFSEAGSLSIVNPYQIHSNPIIDNVSHIKFDTIYVPKEVLKFIMKGKNIKFTEQSIKSKKVKHLFLSLKSALQKKNNKLIEIHLSKFINSLKFCTIENEQEYLGLNFDNFKQINQYIEANIQDKFCLNQLSSQANINKFGFSKKFKLTTGMTPMNYILMRKVFSSKKLIHTNLELTEIAYLYNFTDLAHFSKTFKRFIGISPKKYKESISKKA